MLEATSAEATPKGGLQMVHFEPDLAFEALTPSQATLESGRVIYTKPNRVRAGRIFRAGILPGNTVRWTRKLNRHDTGPEIWCSWTKHSWTLGESTS